MKKIIAILVMCILPITGFSQSLFDKYEEYDDVTSVVISQSMFNLLSKIDIDVDDPEAKEFMDIAKSVKSLKVFTTENKSISSQMKTSVDKYLKTSRLPIYFLKTPRAPVSPSN